MSIADGSAILGGRQRKQKGATQVARPNDAKRSTGVMRRGQAATAAMQDGTPRGQKHKQGAPYLTLDAGACGDDDEYGDYMGAVEDFERQLFVVRFVSQGGGAGKEPSLNGDNFKDRCRDLPRTKRCDARLGAASSEVANWAQERRRSSPSPRAREETAFMVGVVRGSARTEEESIPLARYACIPGVGEKPLKLGPEFVRRSPSLANGFVSDSRAATSSPATGSSSRLASRRDEERCTALSSRHAARCC